MTYLDEWVPISFSSPYLKKQETKDSIKNLRLLAVVCATDRLKHYLLRREITIVTDHQADQALLSALGSLDGLIDRYLINVKLYIYIEKTSAS